MGRHFRNLPFVQTRGNNMPLGYMTDYQKFSRDMKKAGIETKEYCGRFSWKGPAVFTKEPHFPSKVDVIRATRIELQWDNFGNNWVVYPKTQEQSW